MAKHIFVAGLDAFHLNQLTALKQAEQYFFHPLMSYEEIKCGDSFPVQKFLEHCRKFHKILENFRKFQKLSEIL